MLLFILICGMMTMFSQVSVAQQKKSFKGAYNFYGFDGEAIYDYLRITRDSTLKHGNFGFVRKHIDSLDLRIFNRLQATGDYQYGKKYGNWSYLESRNRVVIKDVVFFNVKASLQSMQYETNAVYDTSGAPNGAWRYKAINYQDEKVTELLSSSVLNFTSGSISGKFGFTTDQKDGYYGLYSIDGKCTVDGFMDSLWTFRYMRDTIQIKEKRYYERGFLKEVVKISDNSRQDTLFHMLDHATIAKLRILSNGQSSLFKVSERDFGVDYISGFDVSDKKYLTQTHANGYLKEIMEAITKFDTNYYFENNQEINWPIKTKRFEFVVLAKEDTIRNRIQKNYQTINDNLVEVFASPTFGLNYKRTDSLYLAHQYYQLVDSLINGLFYVVNKITSDEYKFFDAYAYGEEHSFDFMTTDTIIFETDTRSFILAEDFNSGLKENASLLERMDKYLKDLADITNKYKVVVMEQMKLIKLGEELEALQEQILEERKKVRAKFRGLRYYSDEEKVLFNALEKNFLDKQFEKFRDAYSKDELESGKVDKGLDYLNLLETVEAAIDPLKRVFPNQDILDSLYQEEVFNPFTFTSYKRRVHEELYRKGEQLFDHYVSELKVLNDYKSLNDLIAKINRLQLRMKQLRVDDTRSLERGLRGRKTADEIELLLKISENE